MNKYQEALNKLKNMGDKDLYNERHLDWLNILQELINRNEDLELLVMSLSNGAMSGKIVAPETLEASAVYKVTFTLFEEEYDFLKELFVEEVLEDE